MTVAPAAFRTVWVVDFEFNGGDGERPRPVCMVARECRTGREIRLWREDLEKLPAAPFDTGPDALFVAYFASAEMGCFLALSWRPPVNILDLFAEHRVSTNGLDLPCDNSLTGALALRGLASLDPGAERRDARARAPAEHLERERGRGNPRMLRGGCGRHCSVAWPDGSRQPIGRGRCSVAATCWPWRAWSGTAYRSICRCCRTCASIGSG